MTEMKFGLDFVFRMSDSILPGEMLPAFYCKGLLGDSVKMVSMEDNKGTFLVLVCGRGHSRLDGRLGS